MHITILVPGCGFPSSVVGPVEVFSNAGLIWNTLMGERTRRTFEVEMVSNDGKPVVYEGGVTITPDKSVEQVRKTDLVFATTVGLEIDRVIAMNPNMLELISREAKRGSMVAGVCSGVSLLAEAGVLDGRQATTHWALADTFRRRYSKVDWQPDLFITESDNIFCGGGVYAALDLCLHLVERMAGYEIARKCGRALLIDSPRTWQASFATPQLNLQHHDDQIQTAQERLHQSFSEPITVEDIAQDLGMSARNFTRRFKQATGDPPLAYLHKLRIDCAKHLLESDFKSIQEICLEVGYEDLPHFRKLFKRHTGLTPTEYKARFSCSRVTRNENIVKVA